MDRGKFKALVHYVCWSFCDDPSKLGAVKLNKTLWLSDFEAFLQFGKPITGVRYVRRQFGPVPKPILPVLRELEEEGTISVQESVFFGRAKKEFLVQKPAVIDFMTTRERDLVDGVIHFVCNQHTAASISEASHDHVWKVAADGEEIPYFTVFARPGVVTHEDRAWAQAQLAQARSLSAV